MLTDKKRSNKHEVLSEQRIGFLSDGKIGITQESQHLQLHKDKSLKLFSYKDEMGFGFENCQRQNVDKGLKANIVELLNLLCRKGSTLSRSFYSDS